MTLFKLILITVASELLAAGAAVSAGKPKPLAIWPGYVLDVPSNHDVCTRNGPDFHVLYVRDRSPKPVNLVGIYCGFHPDFAPGCAKPKKRTWTANGLSFQSVRGADACAEFLIRDSGKTERGYLDLWFAPGARVHPEMAEALVASIRPASMPLKDVPDLPTCGQK